MASDTKHPTNGRPSTHVVIVGGGFAGIGCARELAGEDSVHVTLIDQHNYHQFQPLLYQVATSQLAATSIASSLRKTFHDHDNVDVKMGEVIEVDTAAHSVRTRDGDTDPRRRPRARRRRAGELLQHPGRGRARVPALLADRRRAAADADAHACSRTPIATQR